MISRIVAAAMVAASLFASLPAVAAPPVPVRIRIIKGSRDGAAGFDAQLADVRKQLERLSYVRWDQAGVENHEMSTGKPIDVKLPDGTPLTVTLVEAASGAVTFELKVPAQKTHSRLTISKDQRIVHQVTEEKAGSAYFVTVHPWP